MCFECGQASRCCFYHPSRQVRCVVHGDDFTFSGIESELKWVEQQMKRAFVCKVEGVMGPGPEDLKEARVLNRVISWHPWGIRYEADPRHAEVLVRELQVHEKESTVTPGVKRTVEDVEGDRALEKEEEITAYRALAARPTICHSTGRILGSLPKSAVVT